MGIQANKVSWRNYAAGVGLANAPVFMLNTYRDILLAQLSLFHYLVILGLLILMGSALSGYLIARKTNETYQNAGITTGLLSYIAYVALSWIIRIPLINLEPSISITGFVVGAAVGAKFYVAHHPSPETA
jgi:hypothetical protein